jgi:hypothetical protein
MHRLRQRKTSVKDFSEMLPNMRGAELAIRALDAKATEWALVIR